MKIEVSISSLQSVHGSPPTVVSNGL